MKKCPWCGKEYPDDVSVCVTDQSPLESDSATAVTQTSHEQVGGLSNALMANAMRGPKFSAARMTDSGVELGKKLNHAPSPDA